MNLWTTLHERFAKHADLAGLSDHNGEYVTYKQLSGRVQGLASIILKYTVPGSKVAILGSHPYFDGISVLASLAAGCTAVPMSLKYGELNCSRIIQNAVPQILLTDIAELPGNIMATIMNRSTRVVSVNTDDLETRKHDLGEVPDNRIAMIMFTSGTTGVPKGAMLSHDNILSNLNDIGRYFLLSADDNLMIIRPLYHAAVMTGEFLHALMCGAHITFYNDEFSPRRLLAYMKQRECTTICATPTLFYHLALSKKSIELESLRHAVVSGECLHPKVSEQIVRAFPEVKFYNVYGLTEASPRVCYLPPEYFRSKVGAVGIPLKSVSVKIVNEAGDETEKEEIGELIVRGPNVMAGYWNDKEQTEQKIRDGWLYTGDLAYVDHDGFVYIVGRKDDMMIRCGMNVYPKEIENILLTDERIKEVMVWGKPDPRYGERIYVTVVPKQHASVSEADIISMCRKYLQPYQWPDEVHMATELPRNASGKLVRAGSEPATLPESVKSNEASRFSN